MHFEVHLSTELFATDEVSRFTVEQTLGLPASATVDFVTDKTFKLEKLVGGIASLAYRCSLGTAHRMVGVVEWVELTSSANNLDHAGPLLGYRMHIISRVGTLAGHFRSRIFQNKTVQEIVTEVFEGHGMVGDDLDFNLVGEHAPCVYCVQYQETDLNFVSRLLERDGIYFFSEFDTSKKKEILRFRDDSTAGKPVESPSEFDFLHRAALRAEEPAVYGFEPHQEMVEGKVVLTEYDYLNAQNSLIAEVDAGHDLSLEYRHFPGDFTDSEVGRHLATVRLQAAQVNHAGWMLTAALPNLVVGRSATIKEGSGKQKVFIHSVVHNYDAEIKNSEYAGSRIWDFEVKAEVIALDTPFRVSFYHSKPVIYGPQTAVVMATAGSPAEEIHTDENARCKVRFHWDRAGINDDRASCWIRVAQLQTPGSMALPRIGWEVIVEFLQGDPDRPIVTGLLYNGGHMPPYALPEGATRTALRSNSSPGGGGINEIRFEDKAGAEEIMIGSQYNMVINTANNRSKTVTKNETLVVGSNVTTEIGADDKITVGKGSKIQVDADQSVKVGGTRKVEVNAVKSLTVEGNATTSVGSSHFEMNGSPLAGLLAVVSAKAAAAVQAKADQAIASVQGAVQGKIDQLMAPINGLTAQADALTNSMTAFGDGNMGAAGALSRGVGGLSTAGLGGGGLGLAAFNSAPKGGDPAGIIASTSSINASLGSIMGGAVASGKAAVTGLIDGGAGQASGGGGASSMKNRVGPDGELEGFSESDDTTGPGYTQYTVSGTHTEKTSTTHVTAVASVVNLNVSGSMTQKVGTALIELVRGDHAESVEGVKTEKQLGLIVATKGGESENASGSLAYTVGGAIIEKVKSSMEVDAKIAATFTGALHKIDATSKITLSCGASSVVIDGGGIIIKSPIVSFTGAKMALTKSTNHA
jgi:type VI secretion system secreted protein VgrG